MAIEALQFGSLRLPADQPFIIAEAGVNHENSLDTAFRMVDEAARAGVDAIKFQSYKAETLASRNSPSYWDLNAEPTRSQFDLFKKHDHFNDSDYQALARHCEQAGIIFMSTPFDMHFADVLAPLMPAYKIASAELTNIPFLQHCARKGKPMIVSVGASTEQEIDDALAAIRATGNPLIALLHCVLCYPTRPEDANLNTIPYLAGRYPDFPIGYSDHVPPDSDMVTLFTAWMLGARIVEKHFTLDKSITGNDHFHSMDPDDVRTLRRRCAQVFPLLGKGAQEVRPCEIEARRQARRSLVAAAAIRKGQKATEATIAIKRPGTGIAPASLHDVVGRTALRDIAEDEILQWDMFSTPEAR